MKKLYKYLPAFIFVGFIGVMFILFLILPKKEYGSSQRDPLEKAPTFSFESFFSTKNKNTFQKQFESYITDHTAGRTFWIGLSSYYQCYVGNNGSNGVYLCKDGYLINDPEDMSSLRDNVGYLEEFADVCGVDTTVLIAPSTGYICDDLLPAVHKQYRDEEMFDMMHETFKTADFVDIRDTFKSEYEDGNQMYYRTDHHWTTYGAYTAYRELGEALGYTPHEPSYYTISKYHDFYGTTYSTSGFWLTEPEDIEVWDNPKNDSDITTVIEDGTETSEQQDMFYLENLESDDKYTVFLDGNHGFTSITNAAAESDEKLLVIKDSFAHSLVPFLADHYSEIIMIDLRHYFGSVKTMVEQENIDRVLMIYSIDNLAIDDNVGMLPLL